MATKKVSNAALRKQIKTLAKRQTKMNARLARLAKRTPRRRPCRSSCAK